MRAEYVPKLPDVKNAIQVKPLLQAVCKTFTWQSNASIQNGLFCMHQPPKAERVGDAHSGGYARSRRHERRRPSVTAATRPPPSRFSADRGPLDVGADPA